MARPWALRSAAAIAFAVLSCACGTYALDMDGAPKVPPDGVMRTGIESGEDYYVWDCYQGSRVVIHQHSTFWSRSSPVMERGPCRAPIIPAAPGPDAGTP
jgi:hypothetical protein